MKHRGTDAASRAAAGGSVAEDEDERQRALRLMRELAAEHGASVSASVRDDGTGGEGEDDEPREEGAEEAPRRAAKLHCGAKRIHGLIEAKVSPHERDAKRQKSFAQVCFNLPLHFKRILLTI